MMIVLMILINMIVITLLTNVIKIALIIIMPTCANLEPNIFHGNIDVVKY